MQVYEAALATIKTLTFVTSIETSSSGDGETFGRKIIATGETTFLRKKCPLGLYLKVTPRNDGASLLVEIYFRNVRGFLIEVFGEYILRRKCHQIENSIFNYLKH